MKVRHDGGGGSGGEGIYDYKRKAVWKNSFRLIGIVDIEGRARLG